MIKKDFFSILLFLSLSAALIYAQDDFSVQARWANGSCNAAATEGTLAFVGNGSLLTSLDISDPENPVAISDVLVGGQVADVFVEDNYAYVSIRTIGMVVIDVSDPSNMILMGTGVSYNWYAAQIFYHDGYVYLVDGGGIMIYDVSDPANPVYIYQLFADGINDVYVQGNFAYIASKYSGLIIYNVEDPALPLLVGVLEGNYWGNSVAVNGTTAYLAASQGFKVIDVTDNTSPQEIASLDVNANYLFYDNGTVYMVETAWGGTLLIDVTNPLSPNIVGELEAGTYYRPQSIITSGNLMIVCNGGLTIFDASNPSNIVHLSDFITGSYIRDIKVKDNLVYITDSGYGLFIFEVESKTSISKISQVLPGLINNNYRASALSGNLLCLGSFLGIYFIDISDPYAPEIIAELPTGGVNDLEIIGDYLYVLFNNSISILDISDPTNADEVGVIEVNATDIFVKDDFAYIVTNNESKVTIFDVSDPVNPQSVTDWDVQDIYFARAIFVEGNYAYTCGHGLNITDISDPNNPVVVGSLPGDFWYSVVVKGDNAYIGSEEGVKRIDISDKENPLLTGEFDTPYTYSAEITLGNDIIYFAQVWNGLYILKDNFPTNVDENYVPQIFSLKQNYPNPFNPTTTIQFSIPAVKMNSNVSLKVYDLLGREVAVLVNKNLLPGTYEVKFNAEGLSSGIYYYRLNAGSVNQTKKMMLIR
ncbi:MAG: beta-propeller domain-containing protein [Melioribacteraceae bacterium]|nr:beta-propeller domain-containing protein [Melioribacteraceae bacterium]